MGIGKVDIGKRKCPSCLVRHVRHMTVDDRFRYGCLVGVGSILNSADFRNIVCPSHENRKFLWRHRNASRRLRHDDLKIDRELFALRQKIERLVRNLEEQRCRNVLADRSRNGVDRIGNIDRVNGKYL